MNRRGSNAAGNLLCLVADYPIGGNKQASLAIFRDRSKSVILIVLTLPANIGLPSGGQFEWHSRSLTEQVFLVFRMPNRADTIEQNKWCHIQDRSPCFGSLFQSSLETVTEACL